MSAPKPQPTARVSDIITNFAPTRRFTPSSSSNPSSVTSLDFDDTGELLLVAQTDDSLQIYNCKQGAWARELKSHKYGADLARFSHHAQSIIYASTKGDDSIRYLSSHDNSYIRYFRGHTGPVTSISLDPSSDSFLSASAADGTVRLWDLRSQSPQGILNLKRAVSAIYDPTASVIAIGCPAAQQIILYDARNYDKAPFATFDLRDAELALASQHHITSEAIEGVNNDWTKLEFSNDGQKLLVATNGGGHYLLNAFDGNLMAYLARPKGPTGRVAPSQIASVRQQNGNAERGTAVAGQGDVCFTPDGRYVVGGSGDSLLCVWDTQAIATDDSGAPAMSKILQPMTELSQGNTNVGTNAIVGYNPRLNLLVTADKNVVLWLPDLE